MIASRRTSRGYTLYEVWLTASMPPERYLSVTFVTFCTDTLVPDAKPRKHAASSQRCSAACPWRAGSILCRIPSQFRRRALTSLSARASISS